MAWWGRWSKKTVPTRRSAASLARAGRGVSSAPPETSVTYRRNRTITDRSSLPEVSPRAKAHHLRATRRKVIGILAVVLLVVGVTAWLASQFTAKVVVTTSGTATTRSLSDAAPYEQAIEQYLANHPLERFRFATNQEALLAAVQAATSEVTTVTVGAGDGLGESSFGLSFRRPVASWQVGDKQYFVDATGEIFTRNYYTAPEVRVVDNSRVVVDQGDAVASVRLLAFIGRVVQGAQQQGSTVTEVELPALTTRQVFLHIANAPVVRMTIDRAEQPQLDDMKSMQTYLQQSGQGAEYIDVRTPGRAFYK